MRSRVCTTFECSKSKVSSDEDKHSIRKDRSTTSQVRSEGGNPFFPSSKEERRGIKDERSCERKTRAQKGSTRGSNGKQRTCQIAHIWQRMAQSSGRECEGTVVQ